MPDALDLDNLSVAEKFIHDAIIAHANTIRALGTSQLFRTAW